MASSTTSDAADRGATPISPEGCGRDTQRGTLWIFFTASEPRFVIPSAAVTFEHRKRLRNVEERDAISPTTLSAAIRGGFPPDRGVISVADAARHLPGAVTCYPHDTINYQMRQAFSRTIGASSPHLNAFLNCGRFDTMPLIRYFPGECAFVMAFALKSSGRRFSHAHCAKPMKKNASNNSRNKLVQRQSRRRLTR